MRRLPTPIALAVVLALALSCGAGGNKDELKFGTALDSTGMNLSGESTTFSVGGSGTMLWFRLESTADFDGRFVRLYFSSVEYKDFPGCARKNTHVCLSQFHVSNPGTFEVKAYLVKTNLDIGEETLVATKTLTLQ